MKEIDWGEVRQAVAAYPLTTLAAAAGLVVASHLTYACYDLLGRRYVGHKLPTAAVLGIAFVSYAFNLNLGSLVGGIGFRMRLYTQARARCRADRPHHRAEPRHQLAGWLLLAGIAFAARQVDAAGIMADRRRDLAGHRLRDGCAAARVHRGVLPQQAPRMALAHA